MKQTNSISSQCSLILGLIGLFLAFYFWKNPKVNEHVVERVHTREVIDRPIYIKTSDEARLDLTTNDTPAEQENSVIMQNDDLSLHSTKKVDEIVQSSDDTFNLSPTYDKERSENEVMKGIEYNESPVPE